MSTIQRIIYNALIGAAVLLFPWWALVGVLILFAVTVRSPYELLVWGLVIDGLYGFAGTRFLNIGFFTWGASFVLLFSLFIKDRLLAYNR